jgi:hypothetical protein
MTVLLAISAGMIMTAIAVAVGGFLLEMVLSAVNRSLQSPYNVNAQSPSEVLVIDHHRTDNNIGVIDWGGKLAA